MTRYEVYPVHPDSTTHGVWDKQSRMVVGFYLTKADAESWAEFMEAEEPWYEESKEQP